VARNRRLLVSLIAAIALLSTATHGQWLNYPASGTPRLPDGKPNLSAPAPRALDSTTRRRSPNRGRPRWRSTCSLIPTCSSTTATTRSGSVRRGH